MLVFFDGEEAFKTWGPRDSIYGARHLASRWHKSKYTFDGESGISDLDRMVNLNFVISKQILIL